MKRGFVLLLFVLLLLPVTSASVSITGPSASVYNLGEVLDIEGHILENKDLSGTLQLSVVCAEKDFPLPAVALDVAAGDQVTFNELHLPEVIVTSSMQGLCHLRAEVFVADVLVDEETSSSFDVTTDLDGTFDVDKVETQLGDSIAITGSVYQKDGDAVEGTAELYFETEGVEYIVAFLDVIEGQVSFEHDLTAGAAGDYVVNVVVRDGYGNEQRFERMAEFTVRNSLHVFVRSNGLTKNPGEHVNIFGDVTTLLDEPVTSGSVEITLDGEVHSTELEESKYTTDIPISSIIKSGSHTLKVTVKDSFGNIGSSTINIDIVPVPTTLDLLVPEESINPKESFSITGILYDQAGEVMSSDIFLEVYDGKRDLVSEREIYSGETLEFALDRSAPPGEWQIKLMFQEEFLVNEATVTVNELEALEYYIQGDKLYVSNAGNVRYTKDIELTVKGEDGDHIIRKSRNLDVEETIIIDLAKEVPSGMYTISSPTGFAVNDVAVADGTSTKGLTWIYTLLAILFLSGLSYMLYVKIGPKKRGKKGTKKGSLQPEKKKLYKNKVVVKKKKLVDKNKKEKRPKNMFDSKEDSLRDFKERTIREIEKTQSKIDKEQNRNAAKSTGKLGYVTGRRDTTPIRKGAKTETTKQSNPSPFALFD
jgi:hypothetical protein